MGFKNKTKNRYFWERTASVIGDEECGSSSVFQPWRSIGLLDVETNIF
jgi:hypothetical protein